MSTLSTLFQLSGHANQGISLRDKKVAFLIAGLGVIGHHRPKIRSWFRQQIDAVTVDNLIEVKLEIRNKNKNKQVKFLMRRGNEGDYLMAGEFVRGGYQVPNFEPEMIIDGGANIGMFAIQAAHQFPNATIVCYEPDPDNFQLLCNNLKRNNFQVKTHKLGLWSKDTTLYYHTKSSETGFVNENPPGVPIRCILPQIRENCWLKLDIEGAEYEVLPTLLEQKQYPRWISMEIHDFDTKGRSIVDLLKVHNYIVEGGENEASPCEVILAYQAQK
ncbi:MAG: FkbM family methyltransferase [Cyanobacteria bacterium P01_E01_bin.6]